MTPSELLIKRLECMAADPSLDPRYAKDARDAAVALKLAVEIMNTATEENRALREQQAELHRRLVEKWSQM